MKQNKNIKIGDLVFYRGRICFVEKIIHGMTTKLSTSGFSFIQVDEIPLVYFKPTPVIVDMYTNHQENVHKIFNHPKLREIAHYFDRHEVERKLEDLWTEKCLAIGNDVKSYQASVAYNLFVMEVINCIEEIVKLKEKSVYQGVQVFK